MHFTISLQGRLYCTSSVFNNPYSAYTTQVQARKMATLPTEKQSISTINLTIPSPSCTPIPSHNNPSTALLPIVPKTTTTITSHPCTSPSPPNPLRRDLILGFSDGLTVPFALCAGLSSLGNSRLVILAGLAELFSGAISMGLGAYLAAFSEQRHTSSAAAMSSAAEEAEEETTDTWMQSASAETQNYAVVKAEQQQQQQQQHGYSAWLEGLVMGLSYFIGTTIVPLLFSSNPRRFCSSFAPVSLPFPSPFLSHLPSSPSIIPPSSTPRPALHPASKPKSLTKPRRPPPNDPLLLPSIRAHSPIHLHRPNSSDPIDFRLRQSRSGR